MNLFKKLTNVSVNETLRLGTQLIDEIFTTKEEKLQGKIELFKMTIGDRDSARRMYATDSALQKLFAIFFLGAWLILTLIIFNYFVFENIDLKDWQIAFVSTIYGGISTKLNTIVDFLFGSSSGAGGNDVKLKK